MKHNPAFYAIPPLKKTIEEFGVNVELSCDKKKDQFYLITLPRINKILELGEKKYNFTGNPHITIYERYHPNGERFMSAGHLTVLGFNKKNNQLRESIKLKKSDQEKVILHVYFDQSSAYLNCQIKRKSFDSSMDLVVDGITETQENKIRLFYKNQAKKISSTIFLYVKDIYVKQSKEVDDLLSKLDGLSKKIIAKQKNQFYDERNIKKYLVLIKQCVESIKKKIFFRFLFKMIVILFWKKLLRNILIISAKKLRN